MKKLKKVKFIIYFVLLFEHLSYGQDIVQNLQKYWYYRQRFEDKFIVISSNNEKGTNIPFSGINNINKSISTCDGNAGMQYYLGVLATEFRLLKDYGQDYSSTLNKLSYALRALDRIDKNTEKYWRGGSALTEDLNGFFMRDDVDRTFAGIWATPENGWADKRIVSCFDRINEEGQYTNEKPFEMSQDNVWHYLLNLALIKQLVDDPTLFTDGEGRQVTIKLWAQKIAYRMINRLHYETSVCINGHYYWYNWHLHWECTEWLVTPHWKILNPITQNETEFGSNASGAQSFFAEAGNWITDKQWGDMHFGLSKEFLDGEINFATQYLADNLGLTHEDADNATRALLTIMGEEYFVEYWQNQGVSESLYDRLSQIRNYNVENPGSIIYFEHFPLIFLVLHGGYDDEYYNQNIKNFYVNELKAAPDCGPHYSEQNNQNGWSLIWSSSNRLVWPLKINNTGLGSDVLFNGLDYMLLHNLFWLVYMDKYPLSKFVDFDFPQNFGNNQIWGDLSNPAEIIAQNKVTAINKINNDGYVTYIGGNEVDLLQGFEVEEGANFEATCIGIHNIDDIIYQKLNYSPACIDETELYNKNDTVVIQKNENNKFKDFIISPNPANDFFELSYISQGCSGDNKMIVSIADISGKTLYHKEFQNYNNYFSEKIDIFEYPAGIYFITLTGNNFSETEKLIKQ